MAHYLTLSQRSIKFKNGIRHRTLAKTFKAGPVTLSYILIFLVAVFLLFYLFQVIFVSAAGYQESSMKQELEELKQQNKNYKIEINEAGSLEKVKGEIDQESMVPIKEMKYVAGIGPVARNR